MMANSDWPEHLREAAPPVAVCDTCERKTWAPTDGGTVCAMPQPNGERCLGVFRAPNPTPEQPPTDAAQAVIDSPEIRELVAKGYDWRELVRAAVAAYERLSDDGKTESIHPGVADRLVERVGHCLYERFSETDEPYCDVWEDHARKLIAKTQLGLLEGFLESERAVLVVGKALRRQTGSEARPLPHFTPAAVTVIAALKAALHESHGATSKGSPRGSKDLEAEGHEQVEREPCERPEIGQVYEWPDGSRAEVVDLVYWVKYAGRVRIFKDFDGWKLVGGTGKSQDPPLGSVKASEFNAKLETEKGYLDRVRAEHEASQDPAEQVQGEAGPRG